MTNATRFSTELDGFGDEIDEFVLEVTQRISLVALGKLVFRSPVDTGRFRGNWFTTTAVATLETTEQVDKSGGRTIKEGERTILGLKELVAIHMQNNLPYGPALEGGHSKKQAPLGMVALTFAELEDIAT